MRRNTTTWKDTTRTLPREEPKRFYTLREGELYHFRDNDTALGYMLANEYSGVVVGDRVVVYKPKREMLRNQ